MILLNGIAMIAMTALAVPIIIHLHRRRKSKVVNWAAMQFLSHSLVNRRRGLTLEHLILLLCRCLLIALFVLAMARPQLTSASDLRWIPAVLLGSVGLVSLAWATVVKNAYWKRLATAGLGILLITSAVAVAVTSDNPLPQWDQPRDVAIVIDASSSMKVEIDGKSNFLRACEEAAMLVDNLPGGSTVSMLVAGPVIQSPSSALANLRKVSEELAELEATGGGANLHRAIEQSRLTLEKASNAQKQIVVFSDNQLRSWQQVANETAVNFDNKPVESVGQASKESGAGDELEKDIELFCRVLPLPSDLYDVSVTGLELEPGTLSIHRPVRLGAELLNGGSVDAENFEVELLVNDKVVQNEQVRELAKNSRTRVDYKLTFDRPGWNIVSVRVKGNDRLRDNDTFHRVVHVAADLPVLIVNGDATNQSFQRPATFLQLALDPNSLDEQTDEEDVRSRFTQVDAIDAAEIQQLKSFSDYQVVLLCDVPRLPTEVADRLARFVEEGGGLWVLPGERCQRDFYNAWSVASTGKALLPMQMMERVVVGPSDGKPLALDFDSVSHATLDPLLETGQHDLSELQVSAYRKFGDWSIDQRSQVPARLTNGDPLLLEHSVGRGRVLVTALSFDNLESNLISRISFPVLAHLWVEYLATSDETDFNYQPQRNLLLQLNTADLPGVEFLEDPSTPGSLTTSTTAIHRLNEGLKLKSPDGSEIPVLATATDEDGRLAVEVGLADAPGVYQLAYETQDNKSVVPFTVLCDEEEFDLTAASDHKLDELGKALQINWIADVAQIEKLARGSIEGIELWKYFAVGALAMIVIESVVMRWIAWRRRSTTNTVNKSSSPVALPWHPLPSSNAMQVASSSDEILRGSSSSLPPLVEVGK